MIGADVGSGGGGRLHVVPVRACARVYIYIYTGGVFAVRPFAFAPGDADDSRVYRDTSNVPTRPRLQTCSRFGGAPGRGHGQGRPSSPQLGIGKGLRARHIPGDVPSRAQDQTVAQSDAVPARLGARIARLRHR